MPFSKALQSFRNLLLESASSRLSVPAQRKDLSAEREEEEEEVKWAAWFFTVRKADEDRFEGNMRALVTILSLLQDFIGLDTWACLIKWQWLYTRF